MLRLHTFLWKRLNGKAGLGFVGLGLGEINEFWRQNPSVGFVGMVSQPDLRHLSRYALHIIICITTFFGRVRNVVAVL